MDILSRLQPNFLYVVSGVLLGVGFIFPVLWPFGLTGVAVFVYAITKTKILRSALLGGFISWTIKSLFAISWFWSTYPIEWIDLSLGVAEAPVVGIYWLTVSMFLGLGGALAAGVWWFVNKYIRNTYGLLIFPMVWVLSELFSSLMFSVWTYGDGGAINTVFSFGYIGYLMGNHPAFLELSRLGGVYILSYTASLLGYLIWLSYQAFSRTKVGAVVLIVGVVLTLSSNSTSAVFTEKNNSKNPVTIAVVDTKFGGTESKSPEYGFYKHEQISEALQAALELDVDYIVLPEDSRYTATKLSADEAYRFFRFQSSDTKAIVIDSGSVPFSSSEVTLRATIYDGLSKRGWAVDKQYLVPQGEFMPYFYIATLSAFGMREAVIEINKKLAYRPGPFATQADLPELVPGILFCFESADPNGVRRLLKERELPFVAHPISHAWFHESKILWQQQDVMLKIQALWNDVPIVSAANMAKGALYTPDGKKVLPVPITSGKSWQVSLIFL